MSTILLIISALYALMTLILWWGWRRIPYAQTTPTTDGPLISVVIPVRNEADNLPHLLADLARQTYTRFEVIVADDSSTDTTVAVVQALLNDLPYTLHLLPLPNEKTGAPKKRAIAESIRIAQGELILTTDGDCRVGPDWVRSFAAYYRQHHPRMMTGPVTFTDSSMKPGWTDDISPNERSSANRVFGQLQTVEFSSLIGSGAATLALNNPTMCNGANLCYEKRVFEEVNGFAGIDHVASGDDELLMHKIARRYPGGVQFVKNRGAIVQTAPHSSWAAFYQQRKRWASKWRAYESWHPSALAVFVFVSNAAPVLAVLGGTAGAIVWPTVLLIIGLKTIPEFIFLRAILRFLQKPQAVWWIPATQLVYPFYVLLFGLAAQQKGFTWKGRSLK
ncbi:glycosyltransferase [Rudanella paleaurantiibacter]|uniref:Glycosyltransferase n=1 Tax=Rudanella paleaurantiibacter TaxID=2614655 RepID=A0A7J5TUM3_9BACT|nr:glycosyltransferase [Rudanella paleaurantiibacter]